MNEGKRAVLITGAGLVSSLGEGLAAHAEALAAGRAPVLDEASFAPYTVHPLVPLNLDAQIPKKLDQRQMEGWQRLGTYAAGLALDSAGLKGQPELLAETQMIVAAGGGERDPSVDASVLSGIRGANDKGRFLNERLMSDLRPTLFLAQLSNLLAGNIAIVHGVVGASRTFMGEEGAGFEALRIAHARIAHHQGDTFLVGGAYSAERWDLPLLYELGADLAKGPWAPVFDRAGEGRGFYQGSIGAFLVAEAEAHAKARGARALARLVSVTSDQTRRKPGDIGRTLAAQWANIAPLLKPGKFAIVTTATGGAETSAEERAFLQTHAPEAPVRAIGSVLGHGVEAQFSAAALYGTMVLQNGRLPPPPAGSAVEQPFDGAIDQIVLVGLGAWRGEALALLERAA